MFTKIKLP